MEHRGALPVSSTACCSEGISRAPQTEQRSGTAGSRLRGSSSTRRGYPPGPSAVVGVSLLVAGISLAALLGDGGGDALTLSLPAWGGGTAAALGGLDAAFAAAFAGWALRFALRPRVVLPLLAAGLAAAALVAVAAERSVPAAPLLAAALLAPAAGRLARLVRAD